MPSQVSWTGHVSQWLSQVDGSRLPEEGLSQTRSYSQVRIWPSQFHEVSQVCEGESIHPVSQYLDHPFRHSVPPMGHGEGKRPLRVVHVGSIMFRAGIELWLRALIRHACPQRLQFTRCIVTTNHYDPGVVSGMGIPVEVGVGAYGVQRAARNCDVMLISGPPEVGAWLSDCPPPMCIAIAHGEGHGTREILTGCANILDHTIAVSPAVERAACQGFDTTAIYNGIDMSHLTRTRPRDEMRASLGFRNDDFVVGCVARFSPEKCIDILIRAMAGLPSRFKLLLVGWGPLYNDLQYLAHRVMPGRVHFAVANSDLGDYYQAMDAFSLVSATEGFGLATMEAMMSRLPVIVTSVGFAPDLIVDRVNGVIVDGDPECVAGAIARCERYPDWAAGIAKEGAKTADQFGHARKMAMAYEDLLECLWKKKFNR